jgi:hypothetical protein
MKLLKVIHEDGRTHNIPIYMVVDYVEVDDDNPKLICEYPLDEQTFYVAMNADDLFVEINNADDPHEEGGYVIIDCTPPDGDGGVQVVGYRPKDPDGESLADQMDLAVRGKKKKDDKSEEPPI